MVNVSVARRYARALFDLTAASSEQVLEQLGVLVRALSQSAELSDLAKNPAHGRAQRLAVIDAVMAQVPGLDPMLANAMRLLVERGRLGYLPDVARQYREQADVKAGRVRGKVSSARPLSAETLKQLERQLEQATQRNVVLEAQVDPSLLGGAAAQVGSVVYDGSLRAQLDDLRKTLGAR